MVGGPDQPVVVGDGKCENPTVDFILALCGTEKRSDDMHHDRHTMSVPPVFNVERSGAALNVKG